MRPRAIGSAFFRCPRSANPGVALVASAPPLTRPFGHSTMAGASTCWIGCGESPPRGGWDLMSRRVRRASLLFGAFFARAFGGYLLARGYPPKRRSLFARLGFQCPKGRVAMDAVWLMRHPV